MRRNIDKVRRSAQRAIRQLKKSNYLETDDTETINYNNYVDIDDISANVNDGVNLLSNAETTISEEPIIKLRNPKRKSTPLQGFDAKTFMKNVGDSYDVQFIKQVPIHPRDRLARATKKAQSHDVEFAKQVPVHPRNRLAWATKKKVVFLKKIPSHPRDSLRRKKRF